MTQALEELGAYVAQKQPDGVIGTEVAFGELTVTATVSALPALVRFLRTDETCRFGSLVDLTAVDHPERRARFDVVYHFLSMHRNQRIRVKAAVREDFPTTGYVEVRYDEAATRVVYEPVKLVQDYRQFDFMSPWEGANYILPGDEKRDEKKA